jgi:hypothetical protein
MQLHGANSVRVHQRSTPDWSAYTGLWLQTWRTPLPLYYSINVRGRHVMPSTQIPHRPHGSPSTAAWDTSIAPHWVQAPCSTVHGKAA